MWCSHSRPNDEWTLRSAPVTSKPYTGVAQGAHRERYISTASVQRLAGRILTIVHIIRYHVVLTPPPKRRVDTTLRPRDVKTYTQASRRERESSHRVRELFISVPRLVSTAPPPKTHAPREQ